MSIDKEDVTTFTALILNLGANGDAFCIRPQRTFEVLDYLIYASSESIITQAQSCDKSEAVIITVMYLYF